MISIITCVLGLNEPHAKHDDCPGAEAQRVMCDRQFAHTAHYRAWGADMVAVCPGVTERFCGITDEHRSHLVEYVVPGKPQSLCLGVDPAIPKLEFNGSSIV